jgi:hypothetical protein
MGKLSNNWYGPSGNLLENFFDDVVTTKKLIDEEFFAGMEPEERHEDRVQKLIEEANKNVPPWAFGGCI